MHLRSCRPRILTRLAHAHTLARLDLVTCAQTSNLKVRLSTQWDPHWSVCGAIVQKIVAILLGLGTPPHTQPPRLYKTQCDWHNMFLSSACWISYLGLSEWIGSFPELVLKFTLTKSAAGTKVVWAPWMRAFHLSPCQVGCQACRLVASHGANGAPCDQGHPDFLRNHRLPTTTRGYHGFVFLSSFICNIHYCAWQHPSRRDVGLSIALGFMFSSLVDKSQFPPTTLTYTNLTW